MGSAVANGGSSQPCERPTSRWLQPSLWTISVDAESKERTRGSAAAASVMFFFFLICSFSGSLEAPERFLISKFSLFGTTCPQLASC